MFKKSVFLTVLVLLAQHLTAQKSISTARKKTTIFRPQDLPIGISKASFVADKGMSNIPTKEAAAVPIKD